MTRVPGSQAVELRGKPGIRAHADASLRPIWPGTTGPTAGTPTRSVASFRRTFSIESVFENPGTVTLRANGRDLLTAVDGDIVAGELAGSVVIDLMTRSVAAIEIRKPETGPNVTELVGLPATGKIRRAAAQLLANDWERGTLLTQFLDDIPVATLVSFSSLGRRGLVPADPNRRVPDADICSGWRAGGEMNRAIAEGQPMYMGEGPPATTIGDPSDPSGWHALGALPPHSLRRVRRIDFRPHPARSEGRAGTEFDVYFRDSYIEPAGDESAIHEYSIVGTADESGTVTSINTFANVLPGPECPFAIASASRLNGVALTEIRALVTNDFVGISTCTHLNDALRSLGTVAGQLTRVNL